MNQFDKRIEKKELVREMNPRTGFFVWGIRMCRIKDND